MTLLAGWISFGSITLALDMPDAQARGDIEKRVRDIGGLKGNDAVARQDMAFKELLETLDDRPAASFWGRRCYWLNVLRPRAKEDGPERAARFQEDFSAWIAKQERALQARFVALGMSVTPISEWPDAYFAWLDDLGGLAWAEYENDFHRFAANAQRHQWEQRQDATWPEWLARWEAMLKTAEANPQALSPLADGLGYLWSRPWPVRDPEATEARLAAASRAMLELTPPLPNDLWRRVMAPMVDRGIRQEKAVVVADILDLAERQHPDEPWLPLWKARLSVLERQDGWLARASGERAQAVSRHLAASPDPFGYNSPIPAALDEESRMLAAHQLWEEALGLARARFNLARNEQQARSALESAAQALAGLDGHLAGANRLLGYVGGGRDEASAAWMSAMPGEAWTRALAAAKTDPVHWRPEEVRRRLFLALLLNDADEAEIWAARLVRLPTLDARDMTEAVEWAAMALRARQGVVTGADAFLARQQDGTSAETKPAADAGNELPVPARPADAAAGKVEAWHGLLVLLKDNPAGAGVPMAVRDYAAWLAVDGDPEGALSVMRALWGWSLNAAEFNQACYGVASAWGGLRGRLDAANGYLAYQRHGPDGPDGKAGTDDDLADPLAGASWRLPEGWGASLLTLAAEAVEAGRHADALRLTLLSGDGDAVARELRRQRGTVAFNENAWREHLRAMAAAQKMWLGHPFVGDGYAQYVRYGAAGLDGVAGTDDDLSDPFVSPPAGWPAEDAAAKGTGDRE